MATATQVLRNAIEAWHREEARERLARWRSDPEADHPLRVAQRHAWLWSPGAQEALEEAKGERQADAASLSALAQHMENARYRCAWLEATASTSPVAVVIRGRQRSLAQAWSDVVTTEDRRERTAIANAIEAWVNDRFAQWQEARLRAGEHARPLAPAEDKTTAAEADHVTLATRLLKDTDDALRDHVNHLTRTLVRSEDPGWHDLLFALRRKEFDGLVRKESRLRRIAKPFHALGFERELNSHVRTEPMSEGVLPRARLALLEVPTDIRLGIVARDWGAVSELSTLGALGRALAHTLVSRALPMEQRRSAQTEIPRVWATLFSSWMTDRNFLRRAYGWDVREAELVARMCSVAMLLNVRRSAALVCLDANAFSDRDQSRDMVRAAWRCEVGVALFAGRLPPSARLRRQFEAQVVGLGGTAALRERFDTDWYRNPRVAEPLRGAAARGPELSAAEWAKELNVEPAHATQTLVERLS